METVQLMLCRSGQLPVIVRSKNQQPFGDDFFCVERASLLNVSLQPRRPRRRLEGVVRHLLISLPDGSLIGLLDESLCVTKAIQTVDCKFNIPDAPVSDLRDISGKRR